jgi:hypothetical protein
MNLLNETNVEQIKIDDALTVSTYRSAQFDLIPKLLDLIVKYVGCQNDNYLQLDNVLIRPKLTYQGIFNTELTQVEVFITNLKNNTGSKLFFKMYVPKLLNDSFFLINGNYYVPTLYILDKPIVIKKKSIKLYSLFNSLSISFSHDIATFTRANIPLQYLFGAFLETDEEIKLYEEVSQKFKIKYQPKKESDVLNYFNNNIGKSTRGQIIEFFENLFFDDYTRYLYIGCYQDKFTTANLTLKNILIQSLIMKLNDQIPEYIDLNYKRLVFMELLLSPLFKRIGSMAAQAARGFLPDEVKMDQYQILKHYLSSPDKKKKGSEGMSGNYLYDTVNLMSSMLTHKVSMLNPGSNNPPSAIADTHVSHYKRVCPISVSNQKPGEVVSVLPTTRFDYCGQFL